jgi:Ricin-type beta-trefoil lectin domain
MHKLRTMMVTLFAMSAAVAAPLMFAQSSSAAVGGHYFIEDQNTGLCLTNPAPAGSQFAQQVVLEPCNFSGDVSQEWYISTNINNIYTIENDQNPSWCLDAETNTNFGVVDTWPCDGISNENWSPGVFGPPLNNQNIVSLIGGPGATHRCLDVSHGNIVPGGVVGIYNCLGGSGNAAQVWTTHLVGT